MTGELFPAKELTTNNDTVNVFVYYDGQLVGYCPIKVWSKRVLTNLTVTPDKSKMSYNFGKGIDDLVTLTVKPVDQLESSDRIKIMCLLRVPLWATRISMLQVRQ